MTGKLIGTTLGAIGAAAAAARHLVWYISHQVESAARIDGAGRPTDPGRESS